MSGARWSWGLWAGLVVGGGCLVDNTPLAVPPPPDPPAAGDAPSPADSLDATTGPSKYDAVAVPPGTILVQPLEAERTPAAPEVHIVTPAAGARLDATGAGGTTVALDLKELDPERHRLFLSLDGAVAVRVTPPGAARLDDLGGSLDPGDHLLVAYVVDDRGHAIRPERGDVPAATSRFSIGDAGAGTTAAEIARVVSLEPVVEEGAVWVDYYVLGLELGDTRRVQLSASPPTGVVAAATTERWAPFVVRGLPHGRSKLRLQIVDGEGRRLEGTPAFDRIVEVP